MTKTTEQDAKEWVVGKTATQISDEIESFDNHPSRADHMDYILGLWSALFVICCQEV